MSVSCTPTLTLTSADEFVAKCLDNGMLADILSECDAQKVTAAVSLVTTEANPVFEATNEAVWLATSLFVLSELFRNAGVPRFEQMSEADFLRLKRVPHWRTLVEYLLRTARPPVSSERSVVSTQDVADLAMGMLRSAQFAAGPHLQCAGITQSKTIQGRSIALSIAQADSGLSGQLLVGVEFLDADGPLSMPLPPVDERRQIEVVTSVFSAVGRGVLQAVGEVRPAQIVSDVDSREFRQMYTTIDTQVAGALDSIKTADEAQAVAAAMAGVYSDALDRLTEAPGSAYVGKTPAFMKALVAGYTQREVGGVDIAMRVTSAFNELMRAAKGVYEKGTALRRGGASTAELHDAEKRLIDIYTLGAALLTTGQGFVEFDTKYVQGFGFTNSGGEWAVDFRRVPQIAPVRGMRVRVSNFPEIRKNPAPAFLAAACGAAPVVCILVTAATVITLAITAYLTLNKLLSFIEGFIFDCLKYMDAKRSARAASLAKSTSEDITRLEAERRVAVARLSDNDPTNDAQARAEIATIDAKLPILRAEKAGHDATAASSAAGAEIAKQTAAAAHKRGEAFPDGLFGLTPGQTAALKWGAIALGGLWVAKKLNLTK